MDLTTIWLSLITNVFNIRALVMALITIGLITIMTGLHYLLVQRVIWTPLTQGIEIVCVALSMLMLRQMYILLNTNMEVAWAYVTAQMTILLFSLYTFRYLAIKVINILMPFVIYGQNIYLGHEPQHLIVFFLTSIVLAGAVIYFGYHQAAIFNSAWQYFILQLVYGGAWWLIVWTIKEFPLWFLINDVIMFSAYMWFIHWLVKRLTEFIEHLVQLDQQVNYDELTGIRNRANFDAVCPNVFGFYQTKHIPITMVMFDIDHFKQFNDQYGHLIGDQVLKHVTHLFEQQLLKSASHGQLFRYGGEEFVILFRGLNANQTQDIMLPIVRYNQQTPLMVDNQALNITVSMGITALQTNDADFDTWFNRVDHALYQAKKHGRNRVTVETTVHTFND